jgi:hypothetical protein
MLLQPRATWPVVAQENTDIASIYRNYLVFLAAIPAVAGFIGLSVVGASAFGVSFRVPVGAGLANMVVSYALTLAMIYVMALIANALAPRFQGESNLLNAFKLIAFGATAGMVGGVFNLLPSLALLGLIAGLYSIYLIYIGIPVLMKTPPEKALGYTAVLIVCSVVAGLLVGLVSTLFTGPSRSAPSMWGGAPASSGHVAIKVPGTEITFDTAKIEAAGREFERAQAGGDAAAAGQAMGNMLGAVLGGQGGKPMELDTLRRFVPEKFDGFQREGLDARTENLMGMSTASVAAQYASGISEVEIRLQDLGAVPALVMAQAAWANSTVDRETAGEIERVYKKDGIAIKELYRKNGNSGSMQLLLPNQIMVVVTGKRTTFESVRTAVASLDLKGLAQLKRAAS